ncbi:MAG: S1 family peptidase, partial [Gammaproteobacteria bacterium]|nr:S1 family peptidase [Gammaproteobacteria bacterium]
AIALVGTNTVDKSTLPGGYGTPRTNPINATIGLDVQKFGRTTVMTHGYVDAVNVTVLVTYDAGDARFIGQIIIKPDTGNDFSLPGDSGALIVVDGGPHDRRPVGLLFASGTGISVANPISDVLNELNIDIDGD